jgi:hypothetical protein
VRSGVLDQLQFVFAHDWILGERVAVRRLVPGKDPPIHIPADCVLVDLNNVCRQFIGSGRSGIPESRRCVRWLNINVENPATEVGNKNRRHRDAVLVNDFSKFLRLWRLILNRYIFGLKDIADTERKDRLKPCEIDGSRSIELDGSNRAACRLCGVTAGEDNRQEPKHRLISIGCSGQSRVA